MPTTIKTNRAEVGKRLVTKRVKADDSDLIICSIALSFPVTREEMAQLTGLPEATVMALYGEGGEPLQHMSLLATKRELLLSGKIARHIAKDLQDDLVSPDKKPPSLDLPKALASSMRFVLENLGAGFRGNIQWKARGEEVSDLEGLLGADAEISLKFNDPKLELKKQGGEVQPEIRRITEKQNTTADLGDGKNKPGRKRGARGQDAAAGDDGNKDELTEAATDAAMLERAREFARGQITVNALQMESALQIGFNRAARLVEQLQKEGLLGKVGTDGWHKVNAAAAVGPGFKQELENAARRSPRRPAARKH